MRFRNSLSMMKMMSLLLCCNLVWPSSAYAMTELSPLSPQQESASAVPLIEQYLTTGKLEEGETVVAERLQQTPANDQLRFGLGLIQLLRSIEVLIRELYRFGFRSNFTRNVNFLPIVRLPLRNNPNPELLTYEQARNIISNFSENLARVDATLAPITDSDLKLPIHFGMIELDLNDDGKPEEHERLWKLYASVNSNRKIDPEVARQFFITFDRGDVHWARGYCHLLMAICDFYLAHDTSSTFERTAHLFFTQVSTPYKFLSKGKQVHTLGDDVDLLDLIALIHLIHWEVKEPARMTAALRHLEVVVSQSKESWKWILPETDDDHEWLPNPHQKGVIPGVRVTQAMIDSWQNLMAHGGKVLAGDELLPFWRGDERYGINVRKVFMQPETFDLVLWVQGSAATPYLQKGKITERNTWTQVQDAFSRYNLPNMSAWFN